jgi:hypothetical protein
MFLRERGKSEGRQHLIRGLGSLNIDGCKIYRRGIEKNSTDYIVCELLSKPEFIGHDEPCSKVAESWRAPNELAGPPKFSFRQNAEKGGGS